jgi:hypothetical protein
MVERREKVAVGTAEEQFQFILGPRKLQLEPASGEKVYNSDCLVSKPDQIGKNQSGTFPAQPP